MVTKHFSDGGSYTGVKKYKYAHYPHLFWFFSASLTYFKCTYHNLQNSTQMARSLSTDMQNDLKALPLQRKTYNQIRKRLGISKGVISKYRQKWQLNVQRNSAGRKAIVSPASKALLRKKILNGSIRTAVDAHKELANLGYDLTHKTATNVLKLMNFFLGD